MKKTCLILLVALLSLIAATPARADLFIQSLDISVRADVIGLGIDTQSASGTGLPSYLSAHTQGPDNRAFALQTKNGFFQDFASSTGSPGIGSSVTIAESKFHLTVGTTTPNTPLILNFNFLGAQMVGTAYYGAGDMDIHVAQNISTIVGGTQTTIWGFTDDLRLNGPGAPGWNRYASARYDVQGIGLPTETLTAANYVNSFTESLSLVLDPFHGILDFGVLQPGETFDLFYDGTASTFGGLTYPGTEASAFASLIDPFSLNGGNPPPQLALQGLTLPSFAAAPEPGTLALLLLGGTLVIVRRRRA